MSTVQKTAMPVAGNNATTKTPPMIDEDGFELVIRRTRQDKSTSNQKTRQRSGKQSPNWHQQSGKQVKQNHGQQPGKPDPQNNLGQNQKNSKGLARRNGSPNKNFTGQKNGKGNEKASAAPNKKSPERKTCGPTTLNSAIEPKSSATQAAPIMRIAPIIGAEATKKPEAMAAVMQKQADNAIKPTDPMLGPNSGEKKNSGNASQKNKRRGGKKKSDPMKKGTHSAGTDSASKGLEAKKEPAEGKTVVKDPYVAPMRVAGLSYATVAKSTKSTPEKVAPVAVRLPPMEEPTCAGLSEATPVSPADPARLEEAPKAEGILIRDFISEVSGGEGPEDEGDSSLADSREVVNRLFLTMNRVDKFVMAANLEGECQGWLEDQKRVVTGVLSQECLRLESILRTRGIFGLPGWSLFREQPLVITTDRVPDILVAVGPIVLRRYKDWLSDLGFSAFEISFDEISKTHKIQIYLRDWFLNKKLEE